MRNREIQVIEEIEDTGLKVWAVERLIVLKVLEASRSESESL